MSKKELSRIKILEDAINLKITTKDGAKLIGVSCRHFRRLKNQYRKYGAKGLIHKSRGKLSNRKITTKQINMTIKKVIEKYSDFGPTLAHEKLAEEGQINFSVETLRKEMIRVGIWHSKRRKRADIHQLRERREQEGELVQADGSPYAWFEEREGECDLLVFIDDATGKLLWLEFTKKESTESYLKASKKWFELYGKPLALYVDKHSVFRVNTTKADSAATTDSNGKTQFGRAMEQLEIELIHANSPQAKGRVERVNGVLQDRLVKELRLRGISSMKEGNKFLPEYIGIYNKKFAVKARNNISAYRPLLANENLEEIMCLRNTRVLSKNLIMQYKNYTYQIKVNRGNEYTLRRARVEVIEKLNGEIKIQYNAKSLDYSVVKVTKDSKEYTSKEVNTKVDEVKKKQGRNFQFNLLGRTFLLWTKADISTLD